MGWFVAKRAALPRLAWIYTSYAGRLPELWHGDGVEVFDEGFFEGCYAGDWEARDFDLCPDVFGSGMRIRDGECVFVAPSHTLEALYIYRDGRCYAVSNSLALIQARFGIELPFEPGIGARFASVAHGIDAYERVLATTPAYSIERVAYDNFLVDEAGELTAIRKVDPPRFRDFASYRVELRRVLGLAFANAADPDRVEAFAPLTTCSSGYDSAAAAALGASLGCEEAITLRSARGGADDSGRPVAEALGLRVDEFERVENGDEASHLPEFLASGMGGEDACYERFADRLGGRVLLTGFHGDKVWDPRVAPNPVLKRGDISGSSLQEFRLHRGFYHIPVPMIGARHHAAIAAISASDEMDPYRLGNDYDRPIPRRIAEEMGVPRHLFGQSKKAASLLTFARPSLLGAEARGLVARSYRAVCRTPHRRIAYALHSAGWLMRMRLWSVLVRTPRVGGLRFHLVPDWATFEHDRPINLLLLDSALRSIRDEYAPAVESLRRGRGRALSPGRRTAGTV